MTHNPAQWLIALISRNRPIVAPNAAHGYRALVMTSGETLAHVFGRTEKECVANAHLIAAAPDLPAALEKAESAMTKEPVFNAWDLGASDILKTIRAAIAKARA
jgi:hypothetical protein